MPLKDKKIIVTGGPTREWLDPVRFISNPSSGKMGICLAQEASGRAGETVFIHGPIDTSLLRDMPFRSVAVESTSDLLEAVVREITPETVLVMAAAPGDYAPDKKSPVKIKKDEGEMVLRLKKNPDILKTISAMRETTFSLRNLFLVGFAAETNDVEEYARRKLSEKKLEMICVNDVSRKDSGFGTDTNIITIFFKSGQKIELPILKKEEVAVRILDIVEEELGRINVSLLTE